MHETFLPTLLACSDAHVRSTSWMARVDATWVAAGIFAAALTVILGVRHLRRPGVLVSYGVVAALTFFLIPAVEAARESARRSSCTCNLKQIGVALHNYCDVYGRFPPAYLANEHGKRMHSWRVLLLPYLDKKQVYGQYHFDEPWDGPHNRLLADKMPAAYRCPSDDVSKPDETSYAAVVGPETMWPGDQILRLTAAKDGTQNTLVIVEAAGIGIHWMDPRDVPVRAALAGINKAPGMGICSRHPMGVLAIFADGSVHFLSDFVSPETLEALFTRAGGDNDQLSHGFRMP